MKQIIFLLSLLPLFLFAQQDTTKVETKYRNGELNEQYSTNKNGVKVGSYTRYTRYGKKYIVGQYDNGMPVGAWEFYSADTNGVLVEKLDFTTHKELFVDSLRVPSLICGPRYFGGNMLKQEYIQNRIKTDFTDAEKEQYKGQTFTVLFVIDDKSFKAVGVSCNDSGLSEDAKKKMEKIVSEMPAWLPPVCGKDKEIVWRFSVAFVF